MMVRLAHRSPIIAMTPSFEPPQCTSCNVVRKLIRSQPVVQRYELRVYECPKCKSLLQLVERGDPSMLPHRMRGG